jgi:DNA-binding NtrC family response regulator
MLRLAARDERGHILVVDDDDSMRELVGLHLRNAGYRTEMAEDATVAGRLILRRTPDVLIVDVEMPYWNGLDFVATMRADSTIPFMPVIVMTAHAGCAQRARRLGLDCLLKPFFKDALLDLVEQSLVTSALSGTRQGAARRQPLRLPAAA